MTNLKSLDPTVAEPSMGSQFFCMLIAELPPVLILITKKLFLVSYSANPSCVPNLKSLDVTFAEISTGMESQNVWGIPLAQTPAKFRSKSCFGSLHLKPKICAKFEVTSFNGCRNK